MYNTEIKNNSDFKNDISLCIEKYFINPKKAMPSDLFIKKIKDCIDNYEEYNHYYPLTLVWEITSNCNLRCKHCFFYNNNDKFNSSNDLSTEQVMKTIDEVLAMDILHVTLTGGEALLREDIFDIISELKSKNISIKLSSNGILITNEIAQKISTLLNPLTDYVQISIDGARAITHEETRGEGTFDKAISGLKNLIANNINTSINTTITNTNILELVDLYNMAQTLGVKKFAVTKISPIDDSQKDLVPDLELLFREIAKIIRIENDNTFFEMRAFNLYDFVNYENARYLLDKYANTIQKTSYKNLMCNHHHTININKNGKVYLCFPAADNDLCSLGDLKKENLINIWEKRNSNILFSRRDLNQMYCKECQYVLLCNGGCPVSAYQEYGTIIAPDKNCEFGKYLVSKNNVKI